MWTKPEGSLEGATELAETNGQLRLSIDALIELEKGRHSGMHDACQKE